MRREGARGPADGGPDAERQRRARSDEFVPERFERVDEPAPKRRSVAGEVERPRPQRHVGPGARPDQPPDLPPHIATELATAAGPDWGVLKERVTERLAAAIGAYERERYRDAGRIFKVVVDLLPNAPSVRELAGLCQYRQGYWRAALTNLEAFAALTGSVDQHPVRMDCERALGRRRRVEALWDELRTGSPEPEVLAEGRLVLAGTLADGGDMAGAIDLLVRAGAGRLVRNPAERHLRQWYVLGDLMERSGELSRARELFARIDAVEPDAYDVPDRLESLGPVARSRRGGRSGAPGRSRQGRSSGPGAQQGRGGESR